MPLQLRLTGLDSGSYIIEPTPFPRVTRDLQCSRPIAPFIQHSYPSFQQPVLNRALAAHLEIKYTYNLYLADTGFHSLSQSGRDVDPSSSTIT